MHGQLVMNDIGAIPKGKGCIIFDNVFRICYKFSLPPKMVVVTGK